MNPLPADLLAAGISYDEYRRTLVEHNGEHLDAVFADPRITEADLTLLRRLPPQVLVAVVEDWCPDVYWTLPMWAHTIARLPEWDLKLFRQRDQKALADTFITKEYARRVPVYAFYDRQGRLQVWWSGRSATAEQAVTDALGGVPYKDADEAAQKRAGLVFHDHYPTRFRRDNFDEILALLCAFHHIVRPAPGG
ncbi:MAG: thioredoxin family protein [Planctomycetota bacterium]